MANYYASARSNYFQVKDPDAFRKWVWSVGGLGLWEKGTGEGEVLMFGIYDNGGDACGWPSWAIDEETGLDVEVDLAGNLAEHLQEGSVAVLMEAGAEKLRYVTGYAFAVNHKGETVHISLSDIYALAAEKLGAMPTEAVY
jgi:hypothetical protein